MIVTIRGEAFECRTAVKEGNRVTLYLGEYDDFGNELTSNFIDFKDEDIIGLEEVSEPTELDALDARLTYVEMMTGLMEV